MATHSAFLRETGIDWTMSKNANKTVGVSPAHFNPLAAFGYVYWVDKATGDDDSDGLTPATAFKTIAGAITVSNLAVGDGNHMNTIYVNGGVYTESLTVLPRNTHLIAIGAWTCITGRHNFAVKSYNCHFHNFWFYGSGAYPNVNIPANCATISFNGCTFGGTVSMTYSIEIAAMQELTIQNCRFLGNPLVPTAIYFTGKQLRTRISHNWIGATTNGILINNFTGDYGNLIDHNVISRNSTDPNSSAQMAYGIKMLKPTGTAKWLIVKNSIEAADAIYSATADNQFQNQCISNGIVQAATGVMEEALT